SVEELSAVPAALREGRIAVRGRAAPSCLRYAPAFASLRRGESAWQARSPRRTRVAVPPVFSVCPVLSLAPRTNRVLPFATDGPRVLCIVSGWRLLPSRGVPLAGLIASLG